MTDGRGILRAIALTGRTSRSSFIGFLIWCLLGGVALGFWLMVEVRDAGAEQILAGSAPAPLPWLPWLRVGVDFAFLWIAVRRFHDQDRPGWLALIPTLVALPYAAGLDVPEPLGPIVLLVLILWLVALFLPGTFGPNRYGPDPRGWRSREHYLEQQRALGR